MADSKEQRDFAKFGTKIGPSIFIYFIDFGVVITQVIVLINTMKMYGLVNQSRLETN